MANKNTTVGCDKEHKEKFRVIAFEKKQHQTKMLHKWIDLGCPLPAIAPDTEEDPKQPIIQLQQVV